MTTNTWDRQAAKERRAAGIAYWRTLSRETLYDIVGDDLDGYEAALSEAEQYIAMMRSDFEILSASHEESLIENQRLRMELEEAKKLLRKEGYPARAGQG